MKLTENFNLSEFQCKCGCEMPSDVKVNITKLASQLQIIRDEIGKPIRLTNAYRCIKHNRSIGSGDKSQHPLGNAGDLQVSGYKPKEVFNIIERLIEDGIVYQGGLGLYNTFVHYDIRGNKARWNG
jgi:uncharacterized protein YcbK (DUF882 family)